MGFQPTISGGERPQTYALDRAATGTGKMLPVPFGYYWYRQMLPVPFGYHWYRKNVTSTVWILLVPSKCYQYLLDITGTVKCYRYRLDITGTVKMLPVTFGYHWYRQNITGTVKMLPVPFGYYWYQNFSSQFQNTFSFYCYFRKFSVC